MNSNLKTSEVLDLAADAIQMGNWTKGGGWGGGNDICLEGAILAVVDRPVDVPRSDYANACPAGQAVREYLGMTTEHEKWAYEIGALNAPLYDWNDRNERTKQEVIEVLRAAAAVERVKEATASATYDTADQPLPVDIPETSAA